MQTILGSSGVIGTEVAKALNKSFTEEIRLVSRNPKQVNPTDQFFKADLGRTMAGDHAEGIKATAAAYRNNHLHPHLN